MAYIDIASMDSYGRYNIKFAKIVGLNTAVYWSCLMNILNKVKDKKTYDVDGYFTLNRTFVTEQTTLTKSQQEECDQILSKLEIVGISPDSKNKIRCNVKNFFNLVIEDNVKVITEITKVSKKSTKEEKAEGKRIGIINRLKSGLAETDQDLINAYGGWIEVVYDKGICRQPQVDIFVSGINEYTTNKTIKLELIKLATTLGYRESSWAIQMWEKDHKQSTRLNEPQKVATSETVDKNISF